MNLESLQEKVRSQMPAERWEHTLGVIATSMELAKRYGADVEKAELAAILHDYAKYWPAEKQRRTIEEDGRAAELLQYDPVLWHAEVAAIVAEAELKINDQEVLDAIRYHTSGRASMTKLEKVVCLADYIEPGRQFPGVEHIRAEAKISLEHGLLAALDHTILFLLEKRKKIFPRTLEARNGLIDEIERTNQATISAGMDKKGESD
mgnify:CR=1 FL=1